MRRTENEVVGWNFLKLQIMQSYNEDDFFKNMDMRRDIRSYEGICWKSRKELGN